MGGCGVGFKLRGDLYFQVGGGGRRRCPMASITFDGSEVSKNILGWGGDMENHECDVCFT